MAGLVGSTQVFRFLQAWQFPSSLGHGILFSSSMAFSFLSAYVFLFSFGHGSLLTVSSLPDMTCFSPLWVWQFLSLLGRIPFLPGYGGVLSFGYCARLGMKGLRVARLSFIFSPLRSYAVAVGCHRTSP